MGGSDMAERGPCGASPGIAPGNPRAPVRYARQAAGEDSLQEG